MIRRQRTAHAWVWTAMAILLPVVLLVVLTVERSVPPERPPVRLDVAVPEGPAS